MGICGYQFLFIIIQLIQIVRGESAGCGSLVTYRQYTVLLDQAPQCYRRGCGAGNASLTTISSPCSPQAPCYGPWKIISDRFHSEWCESCPQHDLACRIQGWPILNTTSMCQFVPNDWIFDTDGECCNLGTEPYEFAKWIGRMCDDTWRDPFKFYDGMAKEDWEEWIQPWNWTVRPLNSTNQPTLSPQCPSASSFLWHIFTENFISIIFLILEALVRLYYPKKKGKGSLPARLWKWLWHKLPITRGIDLDLIQWFFTGTGSAIVIIGSNVWTAIIIHKTAGYHHVSIIRLAAIFCARPRINWMGCLLILKSNEVFVNAALSLALTEYVLHLVAAYCYIFTTNTGRVRDFYRVNHLRPFWQGSHAHVMYSGSLFWTTVFFLFLVAFGVFLGFGKAFLRILKSFQQAIQRKARQDQAKQQQAEEAAIVNLLPLWLREWSHSQIIRLREIVAGIPVPHHSPLVMALDQANEWFYISERVSGQPYLKLQQHDLEPIGRGIAPTQGLHEHRLLIRRERDRYKITVAVAFFMGMLTFASQWMFWDGFVKSSGDRYVAPFNPLFFLILSKTFSGIPASLPFFLIPSFTPPKTKLHR